MENKKKKGIPTTIITITVETKEELTEEQKDVILGDMASRLHGYSTTPPEYLAKADIKISRTSKVDGNVLQKRKIEVNEEFCNCAKPWSMCIVCEKPIKLIKSA